MGERTWKELRVREVKGGVEHNKMHSCLKEN